ncbi:MAG TPA: M64 family metallopeptidase [Candidatus Aminicenantes bacterium]|nr:M64 family metallopeptidase [Candidatus Aminicenantes bacterium]HRY64983.1 M64 family metallopeptidase [Candidatus Aminicenantes bacterium]HRZ71896.1 M64 family metallopeptidase [Candidatus Aminicenantes bacterium]
MRTKLLAWAAALALAAAAQAAPQPQPPFDEFFFDKAWRIDFYHMGDAKSESFVLRRIAEEGAWPEPKAALLPPFDYGRYVCRVYDAASNRLIFSRGFDTMFGEYKTTSPALAGSVRVFERSLRVPAPRRPVLFVIEQRDKRNLLHPVFNQSIDPADYHILREPPAQGDWIYEARVAGDPHDAVDLVFLAEGYAAADRDKFRADVDRMAAFLFSVEPYKALKARFSVRGVFRDSPERGMDEPRQRSYRKTVLDASFNAFDLDRYMLVEADHRMHEMAGQVPYDILAVLVNSPRYGGGSIGLDYCVSTVDHAASPQVFVHELGHSFAYLADEYYDSEVSYNDFYPKGIEPLEPNITALLDPARVKWQDLLSPGIGIPTEYGKARMEALRAELRAGQEAKARALEAARGKNAPAGEIQAIEARAKAAEDELGKKMAELKAAVMDPLADKVGVFEGAGYASKGLYRPMIHCIMISSPKNEFCRVCQRAIARMIDFLSGRG